MHKKALFLVLASAVCVPHIAQAQSYQVIASAQALSNRDANKVTLSQQINDGATFLELDTGLVRGAYSPESASAFASVDLVTGLIRLSVFADTANDAPEVGQAVQGASASANLADTLSFRLDPGVTSATIGFLMNVEGTADPLTSSGGSSFVQLGSVSAQSGPNDGPLGLFRGEVTITRDTDLLLQARVAASCGSGNVTSGACSFDLLNTAAIALEPLPEGVSFTAAGGFNAVVPVPAAGWLFVSGLGILGWTRRRAS